MEFKYFLQSINISSLKILNNYKTSVYIIDLFALILIT